jgi:hypothetical protein
LFTLAFFEENAKPLDNKHMNAHQAYWNEPFKEKYVEQLVTARDSVFFEMCEELNDKTNQDVRAYNMAKKTVTREKLISRLKRVSSILNMFAVPLLHSAAEMYEDTQNLKDKRIRDQETIIKLQKKLVDKS